MAAVTRWNPWQELFTLHDQVISQLFDNDAEPTLTLPIDIRQTDQAYVLEASVPGFAPEEVEVTLDQNVLTIKGSRKQQSEDRRNGWIRRERRTGAFHRQVVLPAEVRADEISASFEHGVLTLTVPRAQRPQPKRIPVAAGAPAGPKVIDAPPSQPQG